MSRVSKGPVPVQWMYENGGGGYINFDEHLTNLLELMYSKCPALKREPFMLPYKDFVWEFNFAEMTMRIDKQDNSSREIIRVEDGMVWIWYRDKNRKDFKILDSNDANNLNLMTAAATMSKWIEESPKIFKYNKNGNNFECNITIRGKTLYDCTNNVTLEKVGVDTLTTIKAASSPQPQPQPQPQSYLPPGWNQHFDSSSGKYYYVSPTGESQWQLPPPVLPSGWQELIDTKSNRWFRRNTLTGEIQPLGGGGGVGKMGKKKRFVKQNKTYKKKRHPRRKTNNYKQ
jgi:hypothetical protein